MGFIKAFTGALGGTFADQWKDFIVPRSDVPATAAISEFEITEEMKQGMLIGTLLILLLK